MLQYSARPPASHRAAHAQTAPTRRRSIRIAVGAIVLAGFGSATALGEGALRSQIATMVQSASDLIAQRSPGVRTRANFSKGKGKFGKEVRLARALPRVREPRGFSAPPPEPGPAFIDAAPLVPGDAGPIVPVGGFFPPGGINVPCNCDFGPFFPIPGPGIIGGGPIIILPPGGEPGPPEPPPPAPIPEPSTWIMMLLGFGALGFTVRRRGNGKAIAT